MRREFVYFCAEALEEAVTRSCPMRHTSLRGNGRRRPNAFSSDNLQGLQPKNPSELSKRVGPLLGSQGQKTVAGVVVRSDFSWTTRGFHDTWSPLLPSRDDVYDLHSIPS